MTKVMIYNNANQDSFYEQTLAYTKEHHHSQPSMVGYDPLDAAGKDAINWADAQGRDATHHALSNLPDGFNFGKDVA